MNKIEAKMISVFLGDKAIHGILALSDNSEKNEQVIAGVSLTTFSIMRAVHPMPTRCEKSKFYSRMIGCLSIYRLPSEVVDNYKDHTLNHLSEHHSTGRDTIKTHLCHVDKFLL